MMCTTLHARAVFTLATLLSLQTPTERVPPPPVSSSPPTTTSRAPPRARVAQALAQLPQRPTIDEVQRAAARRLAIDPAIARGWRRRARAAAALPVVRGEYELRTDQGWKVDQEAGLADELTQDVGAGHGFRVRATWELDRLVFDDHELRAARAALDVERERERVLVLVTQLYFERLQLLLDDALMESSGTSTTTSTRTSTKTSTTTSTTTSTAIARAVRIAEIEALLTAITGLEFRAERPATPVRPPLDPRAAPAPTAEPTPRPRSQMPQGPWTRAM